MLVKYVAGSITMNDLNLWATAYRQILQNHANPTEMKFWLDALNWGKLEPMASGKVHIFLTAPSVFYANFINQQFKAEIESATSQILGKSCEVSIAVLESKPAEEVEDAIISISNTSVNNNFENPLSPPTASDFTPAMAQTNQNSPSPGFVNRGSQKSNMIINDFLDPSLTFDNYTTGPSNQFAYASAFSTSEKPAVQYNPLFIYGPPGVGKTHLLHALGNQIKKKNPHIRAYFVSAEKFVNEFIESIQHKNPGDFRAKYRDNVDLLLIDDIQFIVGKDRSEE